MADERAAEITEYSMPWQTVALDIARCSRVEIVIPLLPTEGAGLPSQTWPQVVQACVTRELHNWIKGNPDRVAIAVTYGLVTNDAGGRSCVTIMHHAGRGT